LFGQADNGPLSDRSLGTIMNILSAIDSIFACVAGIHFAFNSILKTK
jgi:hypothetical protein